MQCIPRSFLRLCLECKPCLPGSSSASVECASPSTCLLSQVARRGTASKAIAVCSIFKPRQGISRVLEFGFNLKFVCHFMKLCVRFIVLSFVLLILFSC